MLKPMNVSKLSYPGVDNRYGGVRLLYNVKQNVSDGYAEESERRRGLHSGRK